MEHSQLAKKAPLMKMVDEGSLTQFFGCLRHSNNFSGQSREIPLFRLNICEGIQGDKASSTMNGPTEPAKQPTKFKLKRRRAAICTLLEAQQLYSGGISLLHLRQELITQHLLEKLKLLWSWPLMSWIILGKKKFWAKLQPSVGCVRAQLYCISGSYAIYYCFLFPVIHFILLFMFVFINFNKNH